MVFKIDIYDDPALTLTYFTRKLNLTPIRFSIILSSLVITCWERADLFALLCVLFRCIFVTFPYGVPGQVWYMIVSIPDLCLLYFS